MRRLTLIYGPMLLGLLVLFALARMSWAVMTTDIYRGTITQEPKIGALGEREIAILAPGARKADTITVSDFCMMPFTRFCRYDSADIHHTFVQGSEVCVSAYGWRFGLLSWKPNLVEILDCPKG